MESELTALIEKIVLSKIAYLWFSNYGLFLLPFKKFRTTYKESRVPLWKSISIQD